MLIGKECKTCEPAEAAETEMLRLELEEMRKKVAALQSQLGQINGRNKELSEELVDRLKSIVSLQGKLLTQTT